jgi:hypothetical protein
VATRPSSINAWHGITRDMQEASMQEASMQAETVVAGATGSYMYWLHDFAWLFSRDCCVRSYVLVHASSGLLVRP